MQKFMGGSGGPEMHETPISDMDVFEVTIEKNTCRNSCAGSRGGDLHETPISDMDIFELTI